MLETLATAFVAMFLIAIIWSILGAEISIFGRERPLWVWLLGTPLYLLWGFFINSILNKTLGVPFLFSWPW